MFENALEKVGHKTECFKFGGSIVQSVFVDDDKNIFAYSDPRKGKILCFILPLGNFSKHLFNNRW